jgi:hypothetical protein
MSIFTKNTSAAADAAIRSLALTANTVATEQLNAILPEKAKNIVNNDVGRIVVGNVLAALVRSFFKGSKMAEQFANELVTTGYQEVTNNMADVATEAVGEAAGEARSKKPTDGAI